MLKQLVAAVIGTRFDRELKKIQPLIDQVHEHEARLAELSDQAIQAQTQKFRDLLHERVGSLETELAEQRAAKHACADPVKRDALEHEVSQLETRLRAETQ